MIALRDDAAYGHAYFQNMAEQGVEAIVIENDATPETRAIIDTWASHGVVREVLNHPYEGHMDWSGLLAHKQEVVNTRDSDWFILWDSDELREPPEGYATLREAFFAAGADGFDTINFDEFVFVPTSAGEDYVGRDFRAEMRNYYFFQPRKWQRLNAFRKLDRPIDLMAGAGHQVRFRGQRIWPHDCVLRHYLFLSDAHGRAKYGRRTVSEADHKRGWMLERARTTVESFRLPDPALTHVKAGGWDRSRPLKRHPCFVYEDAP
ncbi:hypothetical protein [Alkalilacustris brevis]|uniref:hypothetical protein n=1 Tax=Alkalilacustris brevis TaxID=2026338 RepID=UPI0012D2DED6|nr:hypothetical protein [Alkalilacustris brevis]